MKVLENEKAKTSTMNSLAQLEHRARNIEAWGTLAFDSIEKLLPVIAFCRLRPTMGAGSTKKLST
jgi:hypothetical protein